MNSRSKKEADIAMAHKNHSRVVKSLSEFKLPTRSLYLICEALAVKPKMLKWYLVRAQVYRVLGRNQLAFCDYNAALRIDKNFTRAYALRGISLIRLRRYKDAIGDLSFALETEAGHGGYLLARAQAHNLLDNYEAALADLNAAVRGGEPRVYATRARRERALLLLKLGRHREAIEDLRALLASPSPSPWVFTALGEALCVTGRWRAALVVYCTGLALAREGALGGGSGGEVLVKLLDGKGWAALHCGLYAVALESAEEALSVCEGENIQMRGVQVPRMLLHRGAARVCEASGDSLVTGLTDLVGAAALVENLAGRDRKRESGMSAALRDALVGGGIGGRGVLPLSPQKSKGGTASPPAAKAKATATTTSPMALTGYMSRRKEREDVGVGWLSEEFAKRVGEGTQASRILGEAGGVGGVCAAIGAEGQLGLGGTFPLGRVAFEADGDTDEDTASDAGRERALALDPPKPKDRKSKSKRGGGEGKGDSTAAGSARGASTMGLSLLSLGSEGGGFAFPGDKSRPTTAENSSALGGAAGGGHLSRSASRASSRPSSAGGYSTTGDNTDAQSVHSHSTHTGTVKSGESDGGGVGGKGSVAPLGGTKKLKKFIPFRNVGVLGVRFAAIKPLTASACAGAPISLAAALDAGDTAGYGGWGEEGRGGEEREGEDKNDFDSEGYDEEEEDEEEKGFSGLWPLNPPPFTLPRSHSIAFVSAYVQFFLGLAYEKLASTANVMTANTPPTNYTVTKEGDVIPSIGARAVPAVQAVKSSGGEEGDTGPSKDPHNSSVPPSSSSFSPSFISPPPFGRPTHTPPPTSQQASAFLSRSYLHYRRSYTVGPTFIPSRFRAASVLLALGQATSAATTLTELLDLGEKGGGITGGGSGELAGWGLLPPGAISHSAAGLSVGGVSGRSLAPFLPPMSPSPSLGGDGFPTSSSGGGFDKADDPYMPSSTQLLSHASLWSPNENRVSLPTLRLSSLISLPPVAPSNPVEYLGLVMSECESALRAPQTLPCLQPPAIASQASSWAIPYGGARATVLCTRGWAKCAQGDWVGGEADFLASLGGMPSSSLAPGGGGESGSQQPPLLSPHDRAGALRGMTAALGAQRKMKSVLDVAWQCEAKLGGMATPSRSLATTPGLCGAKAAALATLGMFRPSICEATLALRLGCGYRYGDVGEDVEKPPIAPSKFPLSADDHLHYAPPPTSTFNPHTPLVVALLCLRAYSLAASECPGDAGYAVKDLEQALALIEKRKAREEAVKDLFRLSERLKALGAEGGSEFRELTAALGKAKEVSQDKPCPPITRRNSLLVLDCCGDPSPPPPTPPTDYTVQPYLSFPMLRTPHEWEVKGQLGDVLAYLDNEEGSLKAYTSALDSLFAFLKASGGGGGGEEDTLSFLAGALTKTPSKVAPLVCVAGRLLLNMGCVQANLDAWEDALKSLTQGVKLVALVAGVGLGEMLVHWDRGVAVAGPPNFLPALPAPSLLRKDVKASQPFAIKGLAAASARLRQPPLRVALAPEDAPSVTQLEISGGGGGETSLSSLSPPSFGHRPLTSASSRNEEGLKGPAATPFPTLLPMERLTRTGLVNVMCPRDLVKLRISLAHERAKVLQVLGKHQEAVIDFNAVLDSCPNSPAALFRRGLSFQALERFDDGASDFEAARRMRPHDERYQLNYLGLNDSVPVVLFAAGEEDLEDALILGCDDIVEAGREPLGFIRCPRGITADKV